MARGTLFEDDRPLTLGEKVFYCLFVLLLLFLFYMLVFGFEEIANKKAKNPDNLVQGCMYYSGSRKDKHDFEFVYFTIDGYSTEGVKMYTRYFFENLRNSKVKIDDFEANLKKGGDETCHLVRYIDLDYVVFRRIYIYQYLGEQPSP